MKFSRVRKFDALVAIALVCRAGVVWLWAVEGRESDEKRHYVTFAA
jgi:hypothetical protein